MKKLLTIICGILLLLGLSTAVSAEEDHIILGYDETGIVDSDTLAALEEDLERVEDEYDIGIYFIYDSSIGDDTIVQYAENFLNGNSFCTNTVVMVLNEDYYVIKADGPQAGLVENDSDNIFDSLSQADSFADGIRNYYQRVVGLINSQTYDITVDRVYGTPSFVDLADLLSDSEEKDISRRLDDLYTRYGIKAVAVTTNDLHGLDPENYADDFYDYNGYPKDGILFLLSMENRKWHISTKGEGLYYFTDYGIDYIADEMMSDLKDGDYYGAMKRYSDSVGYLIEEGQKGEPIDTNNTPPAKFGMMNVGIGLSAGLIASLVTVLILKGQLKSVRKQHFAGNYIVQDSFLLTGFADMFVNKSVSRSARPKDNGSSGGGGGSSFHTSSSGSTHGGHGGSF